MIEKAHCLFEQSGTFKKEFIKLGIPAKDYDIRNDFGQTDEIIDLFAEIEKAYDGKNSLFDSFSKNDIVFAFFPCTRFEAFNPANLQCKNPAWKHFTTEQKLQKSMALHEELAQMYNLI